MYNINPLFRNVLITTSEVLFHAPTKHTIDPRTIQQSIIVAEERLIRPALTDSLYYAITDAKNVAVTTENIADLQQKITTASKFDEPVELSVGDIVNSMEFLDEPFISLWKQHLWKLAAESVMLVSTPEAFVQFGTEGVIHTVPASGPMNTSGVVTPELRSIKWLMDKKNMDRIDPLTEAMHAWICRHKKSFPQYTRLCDYDTKGVAYKRKSDIILSIYDEDGTDRRYN